MKQKIILPVEKLKKIAGNPEAGMEKRQSSITNREVTENKKDHPCEEIASYKNIEYYFFNSNT